MTPIEALVKSSNERSYSVSIDGAAMWSNGWILVRGDYPAKVSDYQLISALWEKNASRPDEAEAGIGECVAGHRGAIYRELVTPKHSCWINEAFRQAVQPDGCTVHVTSEADAITVRREGVLVGIAMPVKFERRGEKSIQPTDELVWGNYATESNGFYRQSPQAMITRLSEELTEARSDLSDARDKIDELEIEVAWREDDVSSLVRRIDALKAMASESREAQAGPDGNAPQGPPKVS